MGLRDWVSEKAHLAPAQGRRRRTLQWGSETGSRRREPHQELVRGIGLASMGLRDWVSEKDRQPLQAHGRLARASMGLRDWVSEKAASHRSRSARSPTFNGAPRLGLGEGLIDRTPAEEVRGFNGAPRLGLGEGQEVERDLQTYGALQWGSETGSRRRSRRARACHEGETRFNGAPRLGLGEGTPGRASAAPISSFNGAPRLGLGEGRCS